MHRKTRKTQKNKTQKNHRGIVTVGLIYANWCGHCQALKPEWKKMKYNLMKTPSYKVGNYKFMEIEDLDKNKDSKINAINSRLHEEKLEANGYPTIFKIHGGKLNYFQGGRTANELKDWVSQPNKNLSKYTPPIDSLFKRIFGGKTKKNKRK
jgi:thiol-disulfide isomerase/thioredoxin